MTDKDRGERPGSRGNEKEGAQIRARVNPSARGSSAQSPDYSLRLRDQMRENQLLFEIGSKISSTLDLTEVLDYILDALDQLVPFDAACVYLLDESGQEVSSVTQRGYAPGREEDLRLKIGTGIVGWVAMTGQDAIVDDVSKDPRYQMAREETRSEMVVPIRSGDDILGAFNLEADDLEAYDFDDLRRLTKFAGQASIAIRMASLYAEIEEKRRMEQEIAVARRIQGYFLPDADPVISGYDISGLNLSSLEVSGDYFDYLSVAAGQLGLVIADVSGKGIPAGLIMAAFRASLLAEVRNNFAIRTILSKVNRLVYESSDIAEFVTAVYGVLDERRRLFTYANAGHNPPLLFRPGRPVERLSEGGIVLGAFPDAQYTEATVSLHPGDVLCFYTDGVSEALSPEGAEFGEDGLEEIIGENPDLSAKAMCHAVRGAVRRHTAREPLADDLTLIIVKVEN